MPPAVGVGADAVSATAGAVASVAAAGAASAPGVEAASSADAGADSGFGYDSPGVSTAMTDGLGTRSYPGPADRTSPGDCPARPGEAWRTPSRRSRRSAPSPAHVYEAPLRVERQSELFERRMGRSRFGLRHHAHSCHQARCSRRCLGHFGPTHYRLTLRAMLRVRQVDVSKQPGPSMPRALLRTAAGVACQSGPDGLGRPRALEPLGLRHERNNRKA